MAETKPREGEESKRTGREERKGIRYWLGVLGLGYFWGVGGGEGGGGRWRRTNVSNGSASCISLALKLPRQH